MKATFDTKASSSVFLWLDNKICKDGEGFVNKPTPLYKQADPSRSNFNVYASPYKQWVYDSCATSVISGVYNGNDFLTRGSGIIFDFNNGRVLTTGNYTSLSGTVAHKDYNVYYTSDENAKLFIEKTIDENKNLSYSPTGAQPYVFSAPCIFVTTSTAYNEEWGLGGIDMSKRNYRLYVISNNNYNQEALNGLLVDTAHTMIPLIDDADSPLDFYGDLKTGYYNYCELKEKYNCASGMYIKNVFAYKVDNKQNKSNTLLLSFYDIEAEVIRIRNNSR